MNTIGELITRSMQFIKQNNLDISRADLENLYAHNLGLKRVDLYLQYDRPLIDFEVQKLREGFLRLKQGEPVQYIIGEVPFLDCSILCDKRALIPRPETEELTEKIIANLSTQDLEGKTLLDLCTGSGCIGIAIKKRYPMLKVILSDISKDALSLVSENISRNKVEVEILQGDLFVPLKDRKIDFFVSNPPYISENEYIALPSSVKKYEPKLALTGGKTGLEFYNRIAESLHNYILHSGFGWLEIGDTQREELTEAFSKSNFYKINFEKDLFGRDRFLHITLRNGSLIA